MGITGSKNRDGLLVALAALEQATIADLARVLEAQHSGISRLSRSLEESGVLTSRLEGRNRRLMFNPRYRGVEKLKEFLRERLLAMPELEARLVEMRRRPRRRGKD